MDAPSPEKRAPPPHTSAQPNNSILYLGPITIAAWLIIGGVAYGNEAIVNSPASVAIVMFGCIICVLAGLAVMLDDDVDNGPVFASGILGFGIAGFRALSVADAMDSRVLFWTLAGMQVGWVVERTLHPVGRLMRYQELNRRKA
ncbi:hypothetical protein ACHAQA_008782 [Verticillium albo-atrum]